MWGQLLKPHRLPRHRSDRDIEQPAIIVKPAVQIVPKAEKGKLLGPRTRDPSLPYGVTANQARALDAVVIHGDNKSASIVLGIHHATLQQSIRLACKRIPGPHRLAQLIAWANARQLHKDKAE